MAGRQQNSENVLVIKTQRTRLRIWSASDRVAFAAMHADPEVMLDQGGPISRGESDAKLDRYTDSILRTGIGRWAVESQGGEFLGYVGIMPSRADHSIGAHFEIGWRLVRRAWGFGYATEAGQAALHDGFARVRLPEVLAYTAADNVRSQAVMVRLHLRRDASRDFTADYDRCKSWQGLVWVGHRDTWLTHSPEHDA